MALLCIVLAYTAHAQQPPWQQELKYQLEVLLNDTAHTLDGFAKIHYTNHAPDSLHFIWMHLWPNAFRNDRTAYSEQQLHYRDTRFYFSRPEQKGYINQLDFRINEQPVPVEDHEEHQDIVKLLLNQPLAPGETVVITTPFHVQLPFNFGQGGHNGQLYEVVQWYPQPAVYDSKGWHTMPWRARETAYTHPAAFEVSISLPANYVLAAPGDLLNHAEKEWLAQRSAFEWNPTRQRVRLKNGQYTTVRQLQPDSDTAFKTLRFSLEKGYGFSWVADKRLSVVQDTIAMANGDILPLQYYYLHRQAPRLLPEEAKAAFRFFDSSIMQYPYRQLQIVHLGNNRTYAGGIQIRHAREIPEMLARLWFEQATPGNPLLYPWMSNGMAQWYSNDFLRIAGNDTRKENAARMALASVIATRNDQPAGLPGEDYNAFNYSLSTRVKAAEWLNLLGAQTGDTSLREILKTYSHQWKFRNAYPETLQQIADSTSGMSTAATFHLLSSRGWLQPPGKKKLRLTIGGGADPAARSHTIGLIPALGYNHYDGWMAGLIVHNYQLPPARLKFVAAPMFGTGSKQLNGMARVAYTGYPNQRLHSWDAGFDFAKFTYNDFTDPDNRTTRLGFVKLAPWVQFNLKERDARSTRSSYLRLKYFFLSEDNFRFQYDSATQQMRADAARATRGFAQIKLVTENYRVLYPYRAALQWESAADFGKLSFTGNYLFNYPKGGGLNIRGFAGKFFYFGTKNYATTSRYYLNMTGPNGTEDYAYANYFIGRSEFQGWMSQQIMIREGGFKVRTDLLGNKIGRTDQWLAALNFNSTLHPKLPLKLFADIGTYGKAWGMESDQPRLLFDAGLQLSLLKNAVNVYMPLLYSNAYRDYFRMYTGFWQRISFSIDIPSVHLRKILTQFPHHDR